MTILFALLWSPLGVICWGVIAPVLLAADWWVRRRS